MATIFDVAAYILKKNGEMTTWKLQKLCYYAQAWSLVWDDRELFKEDFQAWANGPVCPDLYDEHRGAFKIAELGKGNPKALKRPARETVEAVLKHYGDMTAQYLSELTHLEDPWKLARQGIPAGERSSVVIDKGSMALYYGGLK